MLNIDRGNANDTIYRPLNQSSPRAAKTLRTALVHITDKKNCRQKKGVVFKNTQQNSKKFTATRYCKVAKRETEEIKVIPNDKRYLSIEMRFQNCFQVTEFRRAGVRTRIFFAIGEGALVLRLVV
uniref:Uncharacterized protein n=1 Tax=Romanomermis culicivorax TaxID=13658 RepID=A0A915JJG4_ROMCU